MREPVEKQIGEHRYRIPLLPTSKGKPVLVRLVKLLGGPIGKLVEGGSVSAIMAGKANVGGALAELAANLSEADLDYLCEVFGGVCQVEAAPGKWVLVSQVAEIHFAGRYAHMMKWLGACLEVNFADFFGDPASGFAGFGTLLGRLGESESLRAPFPST